MEHKVIKGIIRHLYTGDRKTPTYRGILLQEDDQTRNTELEEFLENTEDGANTTIVIITENKHPNAEKHIHAQTRPHTYQRVPGNQKDAHKYTKTQSNLKCPNCNTKKWTKTTWTKKGNKAIETAKCKCGKQWTAKEVKIEE